MRDTCRIDLATTAPFRIGALHIEPALRQVSTAETDPETLEPRVMLVLVALARTRGTIVSRDQLIEQCWDSRVVGDDSINRVISRLRKLATAHGEALFSIETISKVGYRLVGSSVEPAKSEAAPADPGNAHDTVHIAGHRPVKRRRWLWVVPPIAAVGVAIGFVSLPASSPDQPVIALDRFTVNGALPAGYVDALRVDMLASNQSNRGSIVFGVPARIVPSAAGREDRGNFTLVGGVTGEGGSAHIHAELTEPGGTTPVWAARYTVPASAAQRTGVGDQIIATTLCVIFATRQKPVPLTGLALTQWANFCAELSKIEPDEFRAVELLRPTVATEPRFLVGWTLLANFLLDAEEPKTLDEALAVRAEAKAALAHSEAVEPHDALVLVAKSMLAYIPRDFDEQMKWALRAAAQPGEAAGQNQHLAYRLMTVGRIAEALDAHQRALGFNPADPAENYNVALVMAAMGREGEAQALLQRLAASQPNSERIRQYQLKIAFASRDWALAARINEAMADSDIKFAYRPLIAALSRNDKAAAFAAGVRFEQLASSPVTLKAPVVIALTASGRDRAAITAEERLIGVTSFSPRFIQLYWPTFARARQLPEFAAMVTRLGLIDYWRKSGHPPDFCLAADAPPLCASLRGQPNR